MYLALGIVFLAATLAMIAGITVTVVRTFRDSAEVISKKNMLYLAPAFLILYFLYVTASAHSGITFDFFYCFSLIDTVLDVFKLEAHSALIEAISAEYPIFYADFVLAYLVAVATSILSVISFFGLRFRNFVCNKKLLRAGCDIVIGDSEDGVKYVKNNKGSLLLCKNMSRENYMKHLKEGVTVLRVPFGKPLAGKLKEGDYHFIVFRDGNPSYTDTIAAFSDLKRSGHSVSMHLEANQDERKIIKEKFLAEADKDVSPYMTCFSKYELMARRFVADYPITRYIPQTFFNPNRTLKDGKEINVVFIGFGKVNYQLFRMCAMQFQFACEKNGALASKPVNYYVYDKDEKALHNEFFSRILYEFDEDFAHCSFPKPEKICNLIPKKLYGSSVDVKREIKELVTKDSFTYFVISLECDLEDASYAQTVRRLFSERENYRIFVRAKNDNGEQLNGADDSVIYFGEDKRIYNHENIVNGDLMQMAQRLNLLYCDIADAPPWLQQLQSESADKQNDDLLERLKEKKNVELMRKKWEALPVIEQYYNLYHALNMPFKLNLLGFDMVKGNAREGVSEEEFNRVYVNSGRKGGYNDYNFFFGKESSNVLAYIEHSRWNALYILYDYTQMPKEDIFLNKETGKIVHKNPDKKQHACVTSYYGLDELIKYKYSLLKPSADSKKIAPDDKCFLELSKIYAYDYMDLDKLYAESVAMGYKLVRRCETK